MRRLFVISSLQCGGAERIVSMMANYWAEKREEVTIITLEGKEKDFYSLHPRVKRIALNLMRDSNNWLQAVTNNFKRIKAIRSAIVTARPDITISSMDKTNVITILSMLNLGLPLIVYEHTEPTKAHLSKVWQLLRRIFYPFADAVVIQTKNAESWARKFVPGKKVYRIPNPVKKPDCFKPEVLKSSHRVVGMGRLNKVKGFDLLIKAYAKIEKSHPDWVLIIIGEGEERKNLERLIEKLELQKKVILTGQIPEPTEFFFQADLFVLSSRYEGFSNALIEALACGIPVISFDCPSGPREIVRDQVDGILVSPEDVDALASAMDCLMSDDNKRKEMALRAPAVLERFGLEKIMRLWENLIIRIVKG